MGGFSSFQKRFGDATVANQTLDVAKETLAAIKEGNFPDIHKMAKMFAPDVELIPVVKYWSLEERIAGGLVNFDGRYFGIFKVYHNNLDVAGSNNKYCRSIAMLHDGGSIVLKSAINIHGDDILSWPNNELEHVGYGTAASIHMNGQSFPRHDLYISFVGFKLGEALPIILEPLNYNNLTGVPFTINGEVIETLNVGVHNGLLSGQSITFGVEGIPFKVNGVSVELGQTYNTIFDPSLLYTIEPDNKTFKVTGEHGISLYADEERTDTSLWEASNYNEEVVVYDIMLGFYFFRNDGYTHDVYKNGVFVGKNDHYMFQPVDGDEFLLIPRQVHFQWIETIGYNDIGGFIAVKRGIDHLHNSMKYKTEFRADYPSGAICSVQNTAYGKLSITVDGVFKGEVNNMQIIEIGDINGAEKVVFQIVLP